MPKLNRTVDQWRYCGPRAMLKMTEVAIYQALHEARQDILTLSMELERQRRMADEERAARQEMTMERMSYRTVGNR